ncbi:hypothetical protein I3843_16G011400 [Carya illinoinensis]|nr:hypothetical protein I3843_16G011400 [Carya illinoinensis]
MEILSSIVGKIGESLVLPIGEQFGYLISYKSNIMILEEKFLKLREKNEAMQQSVGGAEWNQEVVASEVKTWLTNVRERIEEVGKFLEEDVKSNKMCMNGWFPDLKLRYSLGKKAQKNTRAIAKLLEEGEKYDRVFNIAPPLKVRSSSTERFKEFESRKTMIRNVLEALRDEKIDMIAICGMGGIDKTEMAKEIARRVKADGLFHEVATAVVSQTPNLTKIQGELAEMLGTKLNVESLQGRADELYSRLTKSKSVLVILDDVWDPLDLEDVGKMKHGIFSGDCINTPNLISIAEQVVRECARLPIAIVTVGSALRNKRNEYEWKAALQQLKMSIPQNIPGLHPKVYSSIEFSYNYLGSDEAKSCFLLCCLYPEDHDVPIEHLVRYAVAKRFLKGISIVEQIREHVNTIVRNLQRSNLLLDSEYDECIKMHDIVRDVAISIASRDEHGFMVELDRRHEEWPQKDTYDGYTTISLLLGEMKGHPDRLKCPKLQLLLLSCLNDSEILPGNLFNGMNELKMLSLEEGCFSLKSLPPSIQILENLRMLNLESCRLGDVSAIGTLGKLEILGFRDSEIEELPHEIGNLSQLKLLDMKGCRSLKQIAAGVLSRLSRLQELYMAKFEKWEYTTTMEGNGERTSNNANLVELIPRFGQMTVLEISVPSIGCLPKELHFKNSNLRFRINTKDDETYLFENAIRLDEREDASDLGKVERGGGSTSSTTLSHKLFSSNTILWFPNLVELYVKKCESLQVIFDLEGLKVIENRQPVLALSQLRKLELWNLDGMAHVWKNIPRGFQGFQNLVSIDIQGCENLRSLLPATFAKLLVQLQSIKIRWCPLMESILQREDEGGEEIRSAEPSTGSSSVSTRESSRLFNRCLELSCVPCRRNYNPDHGNCSSSSGEKKHNFNKDQMYSLFPYYLIESLGNLEYLLVHHCYSLEVIFEIDEGLRDPEESNYIFNNLTVLRLVALPKLLHIWKKGPRDIKGFNNLRSLEVHSCHSLKCLFTPSIAKLLVKLEDIHVLYCYEMKEILAKESGDEEKRDHVIAFPQVKTLRLGHLPKLECFCNEAIAFIWPSLEKIKIVGCEELKMFVPTTNMKTPKLQGVQHIIKGKVRYSAGY